VPSPRAVTLVLSCLAIALATALTGLSNASEPKAPASPEQIVAYHDSGEWRADTTRAVRRAKTFVGKWLDGHRGRHQGKPAIVLDIDDTSLSLYACAKARDFVLAVVCAVQPDLPAIAQTRSLYQLAHRRGVAVFFITGRPEGLRALTVKQLKSTGYTGKHKLYLRPASDHHKSLVPYKSGTRKKIARAGYRILANVGDQHSDLAGGHSLKTYKLPNPMYFTP